MNDRLISNPDSYTFVGNNLSFEILNKKGNILLHTKLKMYTNQR